MSNKIFVGYDTREDIAYPHVNTVSKRYNNDAEVIPLIQKDSRQSKIYWRELDKLAPTEFTFLDF